MTTTSDGWRAARQDTFRSNARPSPPAHAQLGKDEGRSAAIQFSANSAPCLLQRSKDTRSLLYGSARTNTVLQALMCDAVRALTCAWPSRDARGLCTNAQRIGLSLDAVGERRKCGPHSLQEELLVRGLPTFERSCRARSSAALLGAPLGRAQ